MRANAPHLPHASYLLEWVDPTIIPKDPTYMTNPNQDDIIIISSWRQQELLVCHIIDQ
jgi:hypothetical protein